MAYEQGEITLLSETMSDSLFDKVEKNSIQNVLAVLKNFFEDARPIQEKILPVIENELPNPLQTLREMFGITDLES